MNQLPLFPAPCWLVVGPRDGIRGPGGTVPMGRLLTADTPEEARAIHEEDGGEVVLVLPAPDPLNWDLTPEALRGMMGSEVIE